MVHEGLDQIAHGADLESVIGSLREGALIEADKLGFLDDPTNYDHINDHLDLQAGLLRAHEEWWKDFKQSYTMMGAETEIVWDLAPNMKFMARTDRIVKRNSDGVALVINYKTTGNADDRWRKQFQYDIQVISECKSLREYLNQTVGVGLGPQPNPIGVELGPRWKQMGWSDEPPSYGVIIVGLLKNMYKGMVQSPLVTCWMQAGDGLNPPRFEHSYEWICAGPHDRCPGFKSHRLGKDFRRVRVRDVYPGGIKAWAEHLGSDFLKVQVVQLETIIPDEYRTSRWLEQTISSWKQIDGSSYGT